MLSVNNLSFGFSAIPVVAEVSLEVRAGEALGVIGPNGAGKSTLFDLVAGTRRADSGTVTLAGVDATARTAHQRCELGLARTFQIPRPFRGMTVFENVLVGASLRKGANERSADQAAVVAMERTGLLARANEPAGALRLLDLKRLELARALALEPRILLLDEIAGGLSDAECADLVSLIDGLRRDGVAVLWIEHVVHALLSVVERLVVLVEGRVIASGEPREIMESAEVRRVYLGFEP